MQRIRRMAWRRPRPRPEGWFAYLCVGACAFILLTSAAAALTGRFAGGILGREEPRPELILERAQIDDDVDMVFLMELIGSKEPESEGELLLSGDTPRVLIYHTHTTEAYFPSEQYEYEPGSGWRNPDPSMNIVAVGEKLRRVLLEEYGIVAIHDTTDHEPPKLSSAYSRSLATMLEYKSKYPDIVLFIDVHRDSYGEPTEPADYIELDGKQVARIMFVVGTGKGATGTGFDEMPDFASNYALANSISEYLSQIDKELVRKIRVKAGRYNQHVSSACLLAEVGHNANTLEQALNAVDYLAEAIAHAARNEAVAPTGAEPLLPLIP